ncbi:hypothetical protein [Peribacillus acanthi]|uniref:CDI toxin immunity protein n=1 Tax=Peribacillus acanthi TaxID=2171554 RepID=UPI000D3E8383|nr:hypothetical protein [Peribacillus acanthi]
MKNKLYRKKVNIALNKEERQNRLNELLAERKEKEVLQSRKQKHNEVKELFEEVYENSLDMEILEFSKSNLIINDFSETFPIAFWNRIEWENDIVNKLELNIQDIENIPEILRSKGFDPSTSIFIFWGYDSYPCIKTTINTTLLSKIEEIVWLGTDLYIFCPNQRFVIEFFHDDSINIGWV